MMITQSQPASFKTPINSDGTPGTAQEVWYHEIDAEYDQHNSLSIVSGWTELHPCGHYHKRSWSHCKTAHRILVTAPHWRSIPL